MNGWQTWLAGSLLVLGCGGGGPLLHPAHTLPEGRISFAAGSSGHFMAGKLARAKQELDAAPGVAGGAVSADERLAFTRGALAVLAVAPGVAPFLAARIGLAADNEVGLGYTGRTTRLDFRHAFASQSYALSVGVSGLGVLSRAGDAPRDEVTQQEPGGGLRFAKLTSASGYGAELPFLVGYRSAADVVVLWTGLRAGFERSRYEISLVVTPDTALSSDADATRFWGGGLLGFAVGLSPIQVRVELDAAYESVSGSLLTGQGRVRADLAGWSVTPAAAIAASF